MQVHSLSYDLETRRWSARFPAGDSPRTLVTVFGAPALGDHPELFVELARAYPRSLVIGCSSAGEIHGTAVRDRTLSVTVTRFDRTDLQLGSVEIPSVGDSEQAGASLGRQLAAKPGLRAVLVLCDGLSVNGGAFARSLGDSVGTSVVVTGGLAADGLDFKQTWLTVGGSIKRGIGAAVGFYGPSIVVGHGVSADWIPQGSEWVITRSEGNFVYELDYQPAIDVYRTALADRADELPDVSVWFPLAVQMGSGPPVVRTVIGLDEPEGALVLAGEVRTGQAVRLLNADLENLIEGGARATSSATKTGAPVSVDCLALAVSCFARRKILGSWTGEELAAMREGLHAQRTTLTGFYGYGQISPGGRDSTTLHNQTLSLTVFSEARAAEVAVPRPPRATRPPTPTGYAVRTLTFDTTTGAWSIPLPDLDSARTLVVAFGSSDQWTDRRGLDALIRHYPSSVIIGCSTGGEIHDTEVQDRSLAVSVTRFARTDLVLATEPLDACPVDEAARRIATRLAAQPNLRGVLVFSEGLHVNGSELVRGLNDVFDGAVPVVGALAGDGVAFAKTWVIAGSEVRSDVVAAVGIYGNHVVIGHGSRAGWDRFGLKRTITRSQGNVLHELDGRPALQIYKEYLGERARQLPAAGLSLPLAVRDPVTDQQAVRTLVGIDEAEGSLRFAGDVPTGHVAQFMKADVERLINGATHAALMASENGAPVAADGLVVAISCAGRRHMLGAHVEEELEAVAETFRSERLRISGCYAYGEISPGLDGRCQLHNQSLSLMVITEAMTPVARPIRARPPDTPPVAVHQPPRPPIAAVEPARPVTRSAAMPAVAPPAASPAEDRPGPLEHVRAIAPAPEAALEPRGPIVRVPRQNLADVSIEDASHGDIRVIAIRGRVTETFKGEVAARLLRGRVILDLGDVQRVTSFGVREWLAMFAGANELSECFFARCSEAVVIQLTMIRAFDGGSRILSFFAPYLCNACNKPFERLFDCELDGVEIASAVPEPVRCPRCNELGRFDDDPRSYFAFFGARGGPPDQDIRTVHSTLCAQDQVRPAEDIEKVFEGEVTRVRLTGRLSINIRWRRVFENIDNALVVDLSAVTAVEPSGVQSLDFHLRTMTSKKSVTIEHAPVALLERLVLRPAPELVVASVVVGAFCPACQVARAATIRIDHYLAEGGQAFVAACKRCDARLDLQLEPAFEQYVRQLTGRPDQPALASATAVPLDEPAASASPRPRTAGLPRRRVVAIAAGLGVAVFGLVTWRLTRSEPPAPAPKIIEIASVDATGAGAGDARAAGEAATGWPQPDELPPTWADRPFTIDRTSVYVVGESDAANVEEAIARSRDLATARLLEQLYEELRASPVRAFVAAKVPTGRATAGAIAAFASQYGKLASFERIDVVTRHARAGTRVFVRFKLPRATYEQIVKEYRDVARFRGMVVAQRFPMLADGAPTAGNLVVLDVEPASASTGKVSAGDIVLRVDTTLVTTAAGFRAAGRSAWMQPDVRERLTVEVESGGKARRVFVGLPPRRRASR